MLKLQHIFKSCCLQRAVCAWLAKGQAANFTYQHTSSFTPMPCRRTSSQRSQHPSHGKTSVTCSAGWKTETWGLVSSKPPPSTVPEPGMKSFWWNCINPKWFLIHETNAALITMQVLLYLPCLLCTSKHRVDVSSCPGTQRPRGRARQQLTALPYLTPQWDHPRQCPWSIDPSFLSLSPHLRKTISA